MRSTNPYWVSVVDYSSPKEGRNMPQLWELCGLVFLTILPPNFKVMKLTYDNKHPQC